MRFTEIPEKLKYPPRIRSSLSTIHSDIVSYYVDKFSGRRSQKIAITNLMNTASYLLLIGDFINYKQNDPENSISVISDDKIRSKLIKENLYIDYNTIVWDIDVIESINKTTSSDNIKSDTTSNIEIECNSNNKFDANEIKQPTVIQYNKLQNPYKLSDISFLGPIVPRLDTSKVFIDKVIDGDRYCIYYSLPEIPTVQQEISVTTDISMMTSSELLNLFPNSILYTRDKELYYRVSGIEYDDTFGCILPIDGFTKDQILDNIIKYPLLEFSSVLVRSGWNKKENKRIHIPFWKKIEINGELYSIKDVWNDLPDTKNIPEIKPFISDYVMRRYLLERDILGIDHKYKLFGDFDEFNTLVMPIDEYIKRGYDNPEDIASRCVNARVAIKRSRNPVIRRIEESE